MIVARPFLASTRLALAAAARLGRAALGLDNMGLGDHFRQPAPRILAVGFLRAEAAGGDDQLAADGHLAPGDHLQPLVDVRGEPELEDVDAQLAGGRDLVDILPARPGRGEEFLAQRILRDRDIRQAVTEASPASGRSGRAPAR